MILGEITMKKYLAIVHHDEGSAYGVWFPDLPGCYGAGDTEDEALACAKKSLVLYAEDVEDDGEKMPEPRSLSELRKDSDVCASLEEGNGFFVSVPLLMNSGRTKRVSLDLDVGLVEWIDELTRACNLTRKAWFEQLARDRIYAHFAGIKAENLLRMHRKRKHEEREAAA
jgi:predicted RNase H-like HicB family nuclease